MSVIASEQSRPFYVNPFVEQAAFCEGFGLASFGSIGVLQLSGEDRLRFLNSLSSQQFPFPGGDSCEALFMDGQGRIKWSVGVICPAGGGAFSGTANAAKANGGTLSQSLGNSHSPVETGSFADSVESALWLLCDREAVQDLSEYLLSMRFMLRVEIQDVSDNYVAFACANSRVSLDEYAQRNQVLLWSDPWPGPVVGAATYFQGAHPGKLLPTTYYLVPAGEAAGFTDFWLQAANNLLGSGEFETLEATLVGTQSFEACRIAAWRPRWSLEVDAKAIPNELDWLRTAASTEKGCYPGQETVARIINLGKPPRRLTFLQVDGSAGELPAPGDSLVLVEGGRPVGKVTSVANHFEMGPIALGLVRTSIDPEATLLVEVGSNEENTDDKDGAAKKFVPVLQEIIVPVNGKADLSPAERPGADLLRGRNSKRSGLMGKGF